MQIFHRTSLAEDLADRMLSSAPTSAASSGLFLSAPRRTGKSTFLKEDLRPLLERRGALVIYADLWADRQQDPGDVIVRAVRSMLGQHAGVLQRLARVTGLEKASLGGLSFSLDRVGLGEQVSLSEALAALSDECRRPIALIIDEAQHAITSEKGNNALFALKAARDELNGSRHHGLRIVATGSHRDKLAMLSNSRDQAFFCAPLIDFPPMGMAYVQWFCDRGDVPKPLDPAWVLPLFQRAWRRPEVLEAALSAARAAPAELAGPFPPAFEAAVEHLIAASETDALKGMRGLTALQSSVLRVMAAHGGAYAPFEPATMAAYQMVLNAICPGSGVTVDERSVEQSLAALEGKSLAWKTTRGVYALEESLLEDVLHRHGFLVMVPTRPEEALPA